MKRGRWIELRTGACKKRYAVFAYAIGAIAPVPRVVKPGHGIDRDRRRIERRDVSP